MRSRRRGLVYFIAWGMLALSALIDALPAAGQVPRDPPVRAPTEVFGEVPMDMPTNGAIKVLPFAELPEPSKQLMEKQLQKRKAQGANSDVLEHRDLEDEKVPTFDLMLRKAAVAPIDKAKLAVRLSDLGPAFAGLRYAGMVVEGTTTAPPWAWISRLYKTGDRVIRLGEWDFAADKGGILLVKEFLNQDINGVKGTLSLAVTKSGRARWTVTWAKDGKQYWLDVMAPKEDLRDKTLALELAKAVQM
jgi:hypothetical protein